MMKLMVFMIETGPDRYQPDPNYIYATNSKIRVDQRQLALFVGLIALGLPFAMLFGTLLGACFYDSISHYYYSQFWGDVFVGALVFIGAFLIAYRGANPAESLLATLAGFSAFGVSLFPTSERGCPLPEFSGRALADFQRFDEAEFVSVVPASEDNSLFELFTNASTWHFIAAAVLFAFLAYYSFWVFTRTTKVQCNDDGTPKDAKRRRNRIYHTSGTIIIVSMVAIGLNGLIDFSGWDDLNLTFWFEAFALWAFGVAWMVRGRWFFGFDIMDQADRRDLEATRG